MRLIIFFVLFSKVSLASHIGTSFTFYSQGLMGGTLRNYTYFLLGFSKYSLGPVFYGGLSRSDVRELMPGAGMRFGDAKFFEIDSGYLYLKAFDQLEKGYYLAGVLGWNLTSSIHLVLPIVGRNIAQSHTKRWNIEYLPYLGWHF